MAAEAERVALAKKLQEEAAAAEAEEKESAKIAALREFVEQSIAKSSETTMTIQQLRNELGRVTQGALLIFNESNHITSASVTHSSYVR